MATMSSAKLPFITLFHIDIRIALSRVNLVVAFSNVGYSYAHNKAIVCPFMKQNKVCLTGQNLTKSCSWPLDFCYTFVKGLDLSILKIWGLLVKGL